MAEVEVNRPPATDDGDEQLERFDLFTRWLHWVMAVLVVAMIFIGAAMTASLANYSLLRSVHEPLGVAVLVLVVIRLVNRFVRRGPTMPRSMSAAERRAATASEWLLYALMLALIAAPNMRRMPDLVKEDYGLHRLRAEQWQGYVWVNLDPDAPPLAAQVEPQLAGRLGSPGVLDRYGIDRLGAAATIVYEVESNWKSIVENFTECYHCPTIHPELTAALPQFRSGYGSISSGGGASGATLAEHVEGFSLSGRTSRPRLPGLLAEDDRAFHGVILRPNAFLVLVPDHVAFFRMEPQGPAHTRVVVDWLFDREAMAAADFDASDAVAILDITNRQDFEACRRCQLGMRSSAYRGVLVPAEHIIGDFYAYYLAAMGDPSADEREMETS